MAGEIRVSSEQRVLSVVFSRPKKKNAFTIDMYRGLVEALKTAQSDSKTRVVLFRGEGEVFTSGNDIADFIQDPPKDSDHPTIQFLHALVDFEKPIIAAVDGPAIGIGTTMLMHCDLVYASQRAMFRMPFVPLGLVPEGGSSLLLPAIAGPQAAAELLLLGESFSSERAHQLGLVNEVVPNEALYEKALSRAVSLTQLPPSALVASKNLLRKGHRSVLHTAIDAEAQIFAERLTSPEAMEAMTAFMEKRAPNFDKFD